MVQNKCCLHVEHHKVSEVVFMGDTFHENFIKIKKIMRLSPHKIALYVVWGSLIPLPSLWVGFFNEVKQLFIVIIAFG